MRFLRTVLLFALAALWLPATLHCAMERADLLASFDACCDENSSTASEEDHCTSDPCEVLESQVIKYAGDMLKLPPPALTALLLWVSTSPPAETPSSVSPEKTDTPPEVQRTWQFVERAAPAPRAPGLIS